MLHLTTDTGRVEWIRERPGWDTVRIDAFTAVGLALASFVTALLYARTRLYDEIADPWVWVVGIGLVALPLAFRRRYPVPTAIAVSIGFFVCGQFGVPDLLVVMVCLFLALYSVGAWEPRRTLAAWTQILITVLMFGWVIINLLISSSDAEFLPDAPRSGIFSAYATFAVIQLITNAAYFGGAIYFGERAWRSARTQAQLAAQGAELDLERRTSAQQAVALDRLEIARELHDVVAHHISVMGVQAGAARRTLESDPQRAAAALEVVESSAHSAITELRSLVQTLRSPGSDDGDTQGEVDGDGAAGSTLGVAQLPALVDAARAAGTPTVLIVTGAPRPLPKLIDVALTRVVQEALTNVRKHAGRGAEAAVRLRYETDAVEVEISDTGLTRGGPSGSTPRPSKLGLLGMRERIGAVGGTVMAGPREGQGFIVRARVPDRKKETA